MGDAVRIREATEADAAAAAALWTEAYVTLGVGGRTEPYAPADFVASASAGEVFVVDREDEGGLAGIVVLIGPDPRLRAAAIGEEAELARLAVAAAARGAGIGRALVEHCEQQARSRGWRAIALWSRPGQVEAHRLYESLGYRRLAERDTIDAGGRERWVFGLDLRQSGRDG